MASVLKINKHFFTISSLLVLVSFILEIYYVLFLSTQFEYFGYSKEFNIIKYIEIKLYLAFFLWISYYLFKKSEFIFSIFTLLILFFYMPNSILYAFMDNIRGPLYSVNLFLILFSLIASYKLNLQRFLKFNPPSSLLISGIAIAMLIPIFLTYKFNFNLNTLLLKDIYETRESFSNNISRLSNYLYNWEVKIVVPIMLAFFLIKKKYIFASLSFLILIYLFVISGNKAVYMTSIVTIFFYFLGGKSYIQKTKYLLLFLILALLIIPLIDEFLLDSILFRGTFVMRIFFFPALLNYCYFDLFSEVSLYFSENHFFNLISQSPFDVNSAYLIGKEYFDTNEMYANNGIISDGYMNLGYIGVFLLSLIVSFVFMFFNSIKIDARYYGIFFITVFFILSAPIFTIFVTGGLWLLIAFSFFIMKKTN